MQIAVYVGLNVTRNVSIGPAFTNAIIKTVACKVERIVPIALSKRQHLHTPFRTTSLAGLKSLMLVPSTMET